MKNEEKFLEEYSNLGDIFDLLKNLLNENSEKRISASEALKHSIFNEMDKII